MTVFKCYLKILRQNIWLVIMYLGIFFSVTMVMQAASGKSEESIYESTSINIGIVQKDTGTLAQGFVDYLKNIHHVILMENNPEKLQEELFYRNVEYIIQIPEDFYQTCFVEEKSLDVTKVPGSYSSYYVDRQINSYLTTARTYLAAGFSQEETVQDVNAQTHTPVTKLTSSSTTSERAAFSYYFRYIPYLFLGALCYVMGYILMAFKKGDIQKRMAASAVSVKRQTLEGLLAMGIIGLALWLFGLIGAALIYGRDFLLADNAGYFLLKTRVMLIVALSLSSLLGMCVTNSNMLNGIANLVSLAMCFLCGVFVSMDVMDASVLKVARFLPVYWYEQANETLSKHPVLSAEQLAQVRIDMGVQLLFALVFVCIILVISKYKKEG